MFFSSLSTGLRKNIITILFIGTFLLICVLFIGRQLQNRGFEFESYKPEDLPFEMNPIQGHSFPGRICDIRSFGAVGDGKTNNSTAINQAIDHCSQRGGGAVLIPEGIWYSGRIKLKSNINFRMETGSEIIFSHNPNDYLPVVFSRFEGMELYNYSPFIYCQNCENVVISGKGKLSANGKYWKRWNDNQYSAVEKLYQMSSDNIPVNQRVFGTVQDSLRPSFIQFVESRNIQIRDIYIKDTPMWAIHLLYSDNILVDNIRVSTDSNNTDGIVIDSTKNAIIINSFFQTGDDAISVKSGLDREGQLINRPSENILIENCEVSRGHSGFSIGSEMSGGAKNIMLRQSRFTKVDWGVRLKSLRGRGGTIENIWIDRIDMTHIDGAFRFDMSYPAFTITPNTEDNPEFKNVSINNIVGSDIKIILFAQGLSDSPIENISFDSLNINSREGLYGENINGIIFKNNKFPSSDPVPLHFNNVSGIELEENNSCSSLSSCVDNEIYE